MTIGILICIIIISLGQDQHAERKKTALERNYKNTAANCQETSKLTETPCGENTAYIADDSSLARVWSRAWLFDRPGHSCSISELNNILNFDRYLPRYIIVGYSDEVLSGFIYFEKPVGFKLLLTHFPVKCKWQKGCYKITSSINAIKEMPVYKQKGTQPFDRTRPKLGDQSVPSYFDSSPEVRNNIVTERTSSNQKPSITRVSPTINVPTQVSSQRKSKWLVPKSAISTDVKINHISSRDVRVHSLLKSFDKLSQKGKEKLPCLDAAKHIFGLFKEECTVEAIYELLSPSVNTAELEYLYQLYQFSRPETSNNVTPENNKRYVYTTSIVCDTNPILLSPQ